jgi:hypothetical protein
MDPTLEVLIAQLHLAGVLGGGDIANMARRLRECDRHDLADAVQGAFFGNALDAPDARQTAIRLVSGGNDSD